MEKKAFVIALLLPLFVFQPALAQKNQEPQDEQHKLKVEVAMTVVDLVFTNKRGDILGLELTGDPNSALEVYENGKPQKIEFFEPSEAPLTTVLLVEATPLFGEIVRYQNLQATAIFLNELRKDDWVGLISYDMKPRVEVDFTRNKNDIYQALYAMQIGGFSEANIYDSILEALERTKDVKGKVSIIVIGTGIDTFSRANFDDVSRTAREHRATIFFVNTTWILELYLDRLEAMGYRVNLSRMAVMAARNQARNLAEATGGTFHVPRFETALPDIYKEIAGYLRRQNTIGYYPADRNFDGKKRKIEVRLRKEFFETRIRGQLGIKKLNDIKIRHRTEYYPVKTE